MTDADCFKAVRKLARANAKLLRQQRVLEADLIDAQLTILKQQAQLEAAAIANAGAKDAAQREVAARRELDAERRRADDALQAAQRLHDREAQLRHEADSRRRADAEALAEERRRRGDAENRLREWKARAAQVTQLARHRVARATAARASAQARCASGDDETTFSPSQPDFPAAGSLYRRAGVLPAPPRFLETPPSPPRCEVPPPDEDDDTREPPSRTRWLGVARRRNLDVNLLLGCI